MVGSSQWICKSMNEAKKGWVLPEGYRREQGKGECMVGMGLLTRRPLDP